MLALAMKVAIPAGFMPVLSSGELVLEPCSGMGPETMATMAMPGMSDRHGKNDRSDKGDMPCGFGGHAAGAMATVDPILLVAAIAFVVASVFRIPLTAPVGHAPFLRPPTTGPPALA